MRKLGACVLGLAWSIATVPVLAQNAAVCTPDVYDPVAVEKARQACETIISDKRRSTADRVQAHKILGEIYHYRKPDIEAALRAYSQAIALQSTLKIIPYKGYNSPPAPAGAMYDIYAAAAYSGRSTVYTQKMDHQRALEDLNKAIEINPRSGPYSARAATYRALGDLGRAVADMSRQIENVAKNQLPPSAWHFRDRGELYLKSSDHDRAIRDFDKALEVGPKDFDAFKSLAGRAAAHLAKGDADRALADIDRAIGLNEPNARDSKLLHIRAKVRLKRGELDLAIPDLDKAIEHGFGLQDSSERADFFISRGDAYSGKQEWLKALEDYQSALGLVSYNSAAVQGRDAARAALARAALPAIAPATTGSNEPTQPSGLPERRVALVIGNAGYERVAALDNPRRDAEAIAGTLNAIGFQIVQTAFDLDRERFAQALKTFAAEADKSDWAMIYFAGHGLEVGGVNYLIPVDARLRSDRDVPLEAIAIDQLIATLTGSRKLRLVVLDACRDNPFIGKMARTLASRSIGRGFAPIEPEGGTLVAFAAKHGQLALDGKSGGNSPFAESFARHMKTPALEISKMMRLVRDDVLAATGKQQEPFTYGSLPGQDFYFRTR